jgi:hypothetical protein
MGTEVNKEEANKQLPFMSNFHDRMLQQLVSMQVTLISANFTCIVCRMGQVNRSSLSFGSTVKLFLHSHEYTPNSASKYK